MPTPRKANPKKRGRKPTWRDGNLEQAKKLAALGATDVEMAESLGVSLRTLMRWKVSHPEFCQTLKAAKEVADERVERRLWERAVGYSVPTEKIFCSWRQGHPCPDRRTLSTRHHCDDLLAQEPAAREVAMTGSTRARPPLSSTSSAGR